MPGSNIALSVRYILGVLALLAVVSVLAGTKAAQISTLIGAGKKMAAAGPPPESVATYVAQGQTWEGAASSVGSITAAKGVSVSSEQDGTISRIHFESGATVRQGQVLVELDTGVERAQLGSARARRELAKVTLGRSQSLLTSGSISKAQVDSDQAQLEGAARDADALEAQVARKTVRAPFAGRLGIRLVNLGQYLTAGTPIAVLEAIDTVYVDFTLPQQRLSEVKLGAPVRVTIEGTEAGASHEGSVSAIDPAIDTTTRTIKIRATVPNKDDGLRPGMFADVSMDLQARGDVVAIPASAVVHASYGDSVFVVENKKDGDGHPVTGPDGAPQKVARQQFVRVGEGRGDFVSIADGIVAGQVVVMEGAFKLRNGAGVVVNNAVRPNPQLAPHPENR